MATVITNVNELQDIELDLGGDYELGNDIDASATAGWNGGQGFVPIGIYTPFFTGSFDGKKYSIIDLTINRPTIDGQALFGIVKGVIKNFKLVNPSITGRDYTAGAFAYLNYNGTLSDIHIEGGSITGRQFVGGVVGNIYTNSPTFNDCQCTASVDSAWGYAGDFVGFITAITTFNRCSTAGNVSISDGSYGGGFVGYNSAASQFNKSSATGSVSGSSDPDFGNYGAFVGYDDGGNYNDCYALGNVTGAGDLIGGFAGVCKNLTRCFSNGLVTGGDPEVYLNIGGLVGFALGSITDSFWDKETSGQTTSDGGTGKTTSEMQTLATFDDAGWDIKRSEAIHGDGYPFLGWELEDPSTWLIYTGGPIAHAIAGINITETTGTLFGRMVYDDGSPCEYRFRYKKAGGAYSYTVWVNGKVTNDTIEAAVTGLTGAASYEFAAQARNPVMGDWSASRYFMTLSPRREKPIEDKPTLELIRNIEMAARGRFFTDEEGKAVYKSRYARNP